MLSSYLEPFIFLFNFLERIDSLSTKKKVRKSIVIIMVENVCAFKCSTKTISKNYMR